MPNLYHIVRLKKRLAGWMVGLLVVEGLLVVDCGGRSISLNWVAGVWTEEGPAIILPSLIPPLTFKSGKWDTFQNCFDNLSSSTLGKVLQNKQDFAESACLLGWLVGWLGGWLWRGCFVTAMIFVCIASSAAPWFLNSSDKSDHSGYFVHKWNFSSYI